ncbi:MAG: 50S ribosomal protein L23 [Magnetococcales bacterium]|nr:50S ribosomal protein L23 [Magnetococcales bacterium]
MSDAFELFKVLDSPLISEKSTMCLEKSNQVVFRVAVWANKAQIKAAVEKMFSVSVADIQTMNIQGKKKRFGRLQGRRNHWKKALVRLADGQSIDFYAQG